MKDQKVELLGNLLRYINNLDKGNKTVVFMTALLISWKEMEVAQVEKIINETHVSCAIYESMVASDEEVH